MRFQLRVVALLIFLVGVCQSKAAEPVDVNRATVAELMRVPGITESWAKRIVRFRPYRTKLDLLEEGVVSPEIYRRIRDGIVAHRAVQK